MIDAPPDEDPRDGRTGPRHDEARNMLREVLGGDTYDTVASRYGITRTGVERRIKALAARVAARVSIPGLNVDGTSFVRRLRTHRDAVLAALDGLEADARPTPVTPRRIRILSEDEIAAGAVRLRARSHQPLEDLALYYLMLATGARPLEIARLQVLDYLAPDGTAKMASELRAEVAINGRSRPLYFCSETLNRALGEYLARRSELRHSAGPDERYRSLDPASRLFLSPTGQGYEILPWGAPGQRRFRCRAIQETYRAVWRHAGFKELTTLAVRHTVADRLYARGADETQVGVLLGIGERAAVRELFPRRLPSFDELTRNFV